MSYDVPLKVLSLTPTRDSTVNPSRRMPDKHGRLFCGKTLDEWTMIQLWSSERITRAIFICETEAHKEKLSGLAEKWGIELIVRDPELLHRHNDSGSLVTTETLVKIVAQEYYSLVMTPFVISPCRPPGFFDMLVETYLGHAADNGSDFTYCAPTILCGWKSDISMWKIDDDGVASNIGTSTLRKSDNWIFSRSQHWVGATWWFLGMMARWFARNEGVDSGNYHPRMVEIEPWMDLHIDTKEDWEEAEYWFKTKILSRGEDCYAEYRESWNG